MLWSLRVATIAGTVVRVHVTFVIFLVWIAAGSGGLADGRRPSTE